MLTELLASLRVVVFPPRCACELARPLNAPTESGFCPGCQEALEPAPDREIIAACEYGGPVASAVIAAKFHRREQSARALGRVLAVHPAARAQALSASGIVPVPLAPRRHWERGFNQAEIIARVCGRAWDLPVRRILRRMRETRPQSGLPLHEREHNVSGAFVATRGVSGRWVLIDDVTTSGATLRAAASTLQSAGASQVVPMAACISL